MIYYTYCDSAIEPLILISDGEALTHVYMVEQRYGPRVDESWIRDDNAEPFPEAVRQFNDYFAGKRTEFDLPLAWDGTDFQQRVWQELLTIPFGKTTSYGELARRLGDTKKSRAVGMANGRNPISIIVPCHRVIGSDGKLTGYGGGLPRKAALLAFEASVAADGPQAFGMVVDRRP